MTGDVPPDAHERRLEQLRERVAPRRIFRAPWGWDCYTPGREDSVQAPTLDELERKLADPGGPE